MTASTGPEMQSPSRGIAAAVMVIFTHSFPLSVGSEDRGWQRGASSSGFGRPPARSVGAAPPPDIPIPTCPTAFSQSCARQQLSRPQTPRPPTATLRQRCRPHPSTPDADSDSGPGLAFLLSRLAMGRQSHSSRVGGTPKLEQSPRNQVADAYRTVLLPPGAPVRRTYFESRRLSNYCDA
jgi:hypothetical protein